MSEREQLERSIAALEAQRTVLGDAVVDSAIGALREKLNALGPPPPPEQRKQVTILFADVSGFTAMSEAMDAEDVRDVMNNLWTRLDGAITAHGGLVDKHIGDAVMALFGAPTAQEDDPERAVRAALAMQAELAAFREESEENLAMRIGINTGPVLLGAVGTTAEYTAMGDAVNLASRLEHAAPVGSILISHDTYQHMRGIFDVQPLEPIQVKGKAEPIQVYVVQGVKPRPFRLPTRGVEGIETRMIGRDAELAELQDAFYTAVEDGKAYVVTVVGEAGVGKSRLLYEFRNWLNLQPERVAIFRGRASQEMVNLPYSLIRDLLAFRFEIQASDPAAVAREKLERGIVTLLGMDDSENVEKAHFIGQLIGFDFSDSPHLRGVIGDAQQIHDRAFHYVVQLFTELAEGGPVAIYLEDAHWADDDSLNLTDHLARECRESPLLVIVLTRPQLLERRPLWGEGQAAHLRLELRPLSRRNSRRLVEEILQKAEEIPEDLRDLVVQGAEGNPFYVEELIRMLIEDGVILKGDERWRVEREQLAQVRVPPTLTGVVQARLDSLPSLEREVLQRASVVGRIFWDRAVEQIRQSSNLPDRDSAAGRIGASGPDATPGEVRREYLIRLHQILDLRFNEEELRTLCFELDVEYEDLPAEGQEGKARELVAYLDRRDRVPELVRAGERLRPNIAWGDEDSSDENQTRVPLGHLHGRELVFQRETSTFAGAQEYIFKHAILRDVTYESVLKRLRRVYHAQVAAWLIEQSGERVAEYAGLIADHYEHAQARSQAAEWYGRAGIQAQATYALEAALGHYQKALAVEERWEWRKGQVEVLHILGRRDEEQAALRALETASEPSAFDVAYLWAQYHESIGDYAQARTKIEHALEISQKGGDVAGEARCLDRLGFVAWRQGQYDRATAWYHQALSLLDTKDGCADEEARALSQALNGLGTVHRQQGEFDKAEICYDQALTLNRQCGDRIGEARTLSNLGVTAFYRRHFGGALMHHQQALEMRQAIGNRSGQGESLYNLAIIFQETGDYDQAKECFAAALSIQQAIGNRYEEGNILNGLAVLYHTLGDLSAAERCLRQGLQIVQEIGDKAGEAYILSNLGLVACDQGDLKSADEVLTRGLALAEEQDDKRMISYFLSHLGIVSLHLGRLDQSIEQADTALAMRREIDLPLWTTADLATMAAACLAADNADGALEYARQALVILEGCGGEGPELPQRDYFICYQVLSSTKEEEGAPAALQAAYDLVMTRADKISNPALRQLFLERVPINGEIVREYESLMRET